MPVSCFCHLFRQRSFPVEAHDNDDDDDEEEEDEDPVTDASGSMVLVKADSQAFD